MGEMATDAAGAPAPRLCHVVKWEDFDGYGFNLHADKSKPGQYIGKVDPGSPSEAAGLKGGDRIVEVNGINIANENHKQVVERIKQFPNETRLFVLDDAADDYCKSMKVVAKSTDANVIHLKTPRSKHGDQDDNEDMPTVRLCHLRKWHDYDGYGFNLQYDQSKQQEFIGSVDADSPAETAGIMEGDRIIAVNGDNIEGESHMQVVQKIKFNPSETRLLVVDTTAFNFYQSRSLKISTSLRDVKYMETPVPRPDSRAANGHTAGQDIEQATERQITIPDPLSEPLAADERHSDDLPTSTSEVEAAVVDHIAAVSVDDDAPSPRLCHLVKWTDFDGYGFNLQYDKHTSTEYIGDVDQGSPADLTAMKKGDRLIEVNDENMERREHADIIRHIKSNANETRLLVADRETYDYYNDKGITITGSMKSVAHHKTPARQPRANGPDVADESDDTPHIRHCTIRKWPDFDGYGFHLSHHGTNEFVGGVDEGSPAEAGGLRKDDRVVEVNDTAVEGKTHNKIIELVKQRPLQASFLVVDQEADKVFTNRGIKIVATLKNVERLETPERQAQVAEEDKDMPEVRLCTIHQWPDFQGFGFNVRFEKTSPLKFISHVDLSSPAGASGVRIGDHLIAINGQNVEAKDKRAVVHITNSNPTQAELLVVGDSAYKYYKSRNIRISSQLNNVTKLETPVPRPGTELKDDIPPVRLCIIRKWPDYDGYGFALHYDVPKQHTFIGGVDEGSPAEAGGLREGDRVTEINDEVVEGKTHTEVIAFVKQRPLQASFLVVDPEADQLFTTRGIKIVATLKNVEKLETPIREAKAAEVAAEPESEDLPHIRHCTIRKWPDFDGYGFHLARHRSTDEECIDNVDEDSPAEAGGLREGDRVIEVNDMAVEGKTHAEVIELVKQRPLQASFLVVDQEADKVFTDRGIKIVATLENVERLETPERQAPVAVVPAVAEPESEDLPHIRHCTIRKWPDFDGYGFNLVCDVAKAEEFIGNVDKDSPAEAGGLMRGDRVIEVNDVAVEGKTHAEAIELVKQRPLQTSFLVVDQEADKVFTDRGIKIVATLENVERLETPIREAKVSEILAEPESEDLPHIRHCTIRKWPDFDGYGFHLDHHLSKDGECIGIVDAGSPAEAGGLREGDRIIEVNDVALEGKTHAEAIELVKQRPLQVSFLVVDQEADQVFTDKGIKIVATLKNVERLETPERQATVFKVEQEAEAEDDLPPVRLCTIRKWSDYDGYGFNLQYDKGTRQEFIGSVEDGGPAETGGLRGGDRVVEVNGENVEGKGHADVVALVKQHATHAAFLVVDVEADRLFGARGMRVLATLGSVTKMETPLPRPGNVILPRNEDNGIPDSVPRPRLAHVCKWPDFQGYGFNLLADKNGLGEFLGDIDKDGPADLAGLRKGDRIVEVNGSNIENDSHPQVVNKIKAMPDNTKMLVVDSETDEYYKSRNIAVSGSMDNIDYKKTPASRPASSMRINGDSETRAPAPVSSPAAPPSQADGDVTFNMTASELRARLQSKKKKDPRMSAQLDAKTKSDMLNKL
ncbi:PREDICTED: uncharacterized protein LOC106807044 isoform X2 [Priapulus caudatus]|uniref:Uncharacterized protein LOC106807044 isoform X2 n=1 Tax=Priapulus caudatus TaxID=37621 RepID=A0ABM1DXS6_PRICU|nr:PREDICTED: uncharacterized protein LOC106807044 isoform X2 [Priapulus caudatus]